MDQTMQEKIPSLTPESTSEEMAHAIFDVLDAKKAYKLKVLRVNDQTVITDYFVIATGGSPSNIQAICDHVEDEAAKLGVRHINKEGYDNAEWVLLGYDDVIVHIFKGELREFYNLEHIWKDAKTIDISDLLKED